jgi:hypothetical protein
MTLTKDSDKKKSAVRAQRRGLFDIYGRDNRNGDRPPTLFFPYTQIGISTSIRQMIPSITTSALGLLLDFAGGQAFFELGFDGFAKAAMDMRSEAVQ